jgi:hypothetical protein
LLRVLQKDMLLHIGKILGGIVLAIVVYTCLTTYVVYEYQRTYPLLKRNCHVVETCFATDKQQKIPKIIYRLGETDSVEIDLASKKTKENNTGYKEIKIPLEEAEQLLKTKFYRLFVQYEKINPIYNQCKRDILVYNWMYQNGGVFLEDDVWAESLCKLIEPQDEMLISPWTFPLGVQTMKNAPSTGDYQQWWIVVKPKHPFLFELMKAITYQIENLNQRFFPTGKEGGHHLTGGVIFTDTLNRMENEGMTEYRIVCANGNNLLHSIVYDQEWVRKGEERYPNTKGSMLK